MIDEYHVRDVATRVNTELTGGLRAHLLPRVWVVVDVTIVVDATGPQFLEQSDHTAGAWSAVDPYSQWCRLWVDVAGFKEPPSAHCQPRSIVDVIVRTIATYQKTCCSSSISV